MTCVGCGTDTNVELWLMGLYKMDLCPTCGESNPSFAAMDGTRPVRYRDLEAHRFSEGLADMVKLLENA